MEREIYLVGLNHRTAGVEVRESFALADVPFLSGGLLPVSRLCGNMAASLAANGRNSQSPDQFEALAEALVLSTCNRVEILALGGPEAPETILNCWCAAKNGQREALEPFVYCHQGIEAVRHLFTVTASLDSMVLGEPQILGQIKDAYREAHALGSTGVVLNRLLHQAFSVAKRVRSETGVASAAVSVSYAAVELAKRIFGNMSAYQAMLVGAGEMAELAAAHLVNAGIKSVRVANRTRQRAEELAAQFGGLAVPFADLLEQFKEVDIVISSTGAPGTVVNAPDLARVMRRRKNRPMFFIDIAVPRDIDPAVNDLDNVYLYDIDDLREVVEENQAQRQGEAVKGRAIVEEEAAAFMLWREQLSLKPTITELLSASESLAAAEVERTLRNLRALLDLTPAQAEQARACLEAMQKALVKKFSHQPISYLRRKFYEEHQNSAGKPVLDEQLGLIRRIFGLDSLGLKRGPGPRGPHGPARLVRKK